MKSKLFQVVTTADKITEEFSDGSYIETDRKTGKEMAVGQAAFEEYFTRKLTARIEKDVKYLIERIDSMKKAAQSMHDFISTADHHQVKHAVKVLIPKLEATENQKAALRNLVTMRLAQLNSQAVVSHKKRWK